MKLSIIIPVYNEAGTVLSLIEKVERSDIGDIQKELIIVDDFSKDGTRKLLEQVNHKVIFHEKNKGKGAAVRTGLSHATGDIILIQDADLEYDPDEYSSILKPIIDKETQVVYGSRFLRKHKAKYQIYYLGNIFLSFVTRILYFRNITDMETCYKVFTKEVAQNLSLKAERFDLEPEITAKIIKKGYKIIEVPISYQCRDFKEGKKISWKDGVKAIWYLLKYRFVD